MPIALKGKLCREIVESKLEMASVVWSGSQRYGPDLHRTANL